jgi:hypothetical protein
MVEFKKAADIFNHFSEDFDRSTYIFFDFETTGLPNRLPDAQITQVTAAALQISDSFLPTLVGVFNRSAYLNDQTIRDLDKEFPDKGWTIRQTLDFNRYDITKFSSDPASVFPETPPGFESPKRRVCQNLSELYSQIDLEISHDFDFSHESILCRDLISFIDSYNFVTKPAVLVAHNAPFDMTFLLSRSKFYGLSIEAIGSIRVFDTQDFMQTYLESVVQTSSDTALKDRLNSFYKGKPFRYNLDYVASSFGVLDGNSSHTSSADVVALVKSYFKALHFVRISGDLDIESSLKLAIQNRLSLVSRP